MPSPRCCAVSRVRVEASRPDPVSEISMVRALYSSGMAPGGNSMSITAPVTRATRPVARWAGASEAWVWAGVVMCPYSPWVGPRGRAAKFSAFGAAGSGKGVGAAHDLGDLLGDLRLTCGVRQPGELGDLGLRVVGGGLHRPLAGGMLGGHRLQPDVDGPILGRAAGARGEVLSVRCGRIRQGRWRRPRSR